jgi:hypothetical protein
MRPQSIVLFEKVYLAAIVLGVINTVMSWSLVTQAASDPALQKTGVASGLLVGALIIGILIPLLLWYFIARRASNVAKWIYVVLLAFGVLGFLRGLSVPNAPGGLTLVIGALSLALQVWAGVLLFKPDATAWLESKSADAPVDSTTID